MKRKNDNNGYKNLLWAQELIKTLKKLIEKGNSIGNRIKSEWNLKNNAIIECHIYFYDWAEEIKILSLKEEKKEFLKNYNCLNSPDKVAPISKTASFLEFNEVGYMINGIEKNDLEEDCFGELKIKKDKANRLMENIIEAIKEKTECLRKIRADLIEANPENLLVCKELIFDPNSGITLCGKVKRKFGKNTDEYKLLKYFLENKGKNDRKGPFKVLFGAEYNNYLQNARIKTTVNNLRRHLKMSEGKENNDLFESLGYGTNSYKIKCK